MAADLGQCPYGHAALKDIPILYGLPIFEGPEGEALRKLIENHEVTLGGCCIDPGSPTVSTTCLDCGFTYSQESDSWFRNSEDPQSFRPVIGDVVRSFQPVESERWYFGQRLVADGSWEESVTFRSRASEADLIAYVTAWLKAHDLSPKPPREPTPDLPWQIPELSGGPEWRDAAGTWRISLLKLTDETMVHLDFSLPPKKDGEEPTVH